MRSEWKQVRLGDICDIRRGSSPRPIKDYLSDNGMPWVKISDATSSDSRYINKTEQYIKLIGVKKSVIVQPEALILSNSGTAGLPKFMGITACIHDGWQVFTSFNGIDRYYLYYLLLFIRIALLHNAYDSVMKNLTLDMLRDYVFPVPSLSEQKAIAATLSCLDDKIELNNKINTNLEAQAQAVFKSWFVDFEPFQDGEFVDSELGPIPKGWQAGSLSDFCSMISRGIAPKYAEDNEQIIINQKCIRDHIVNLKLARCHKPKLINEKWIRYGDILVNSTGQGTLGRTAQWLGLAQNVTVDSHVTIVRPQSAELIFFLGQLVMGREYEIENMASGSTGQTELSRHRLGELSVILPPDNILENYSKSVKPLYEKIYQNIKLSNAIASLRDTLLPKLMSGEIEVPVAEAIIQERS